MRTIFRQPAQHRLGYITLCWCRFQGRCLTCFENIRFRLALLYGACLQDDKHHLTQPSQLNPLYSPGAKDAGKGHAFSSDKTHSEASHQAKVTAMTVPAGHHAHQLLTRGRSDVSDIWFDAASHCSAWSMSSIERLSRASHELAAHEAHEEHEYTAIDPTRVATHRAPTTATRLQGAIHHTCAAPATPHAASSTCSSTLDVTAIDLAALAAHMRDLWAAQAQPSRAYAAFTGWCAARGHGQAQTAKELLEQEGVNVAQLQQVGTCRYAHAPLSSPQCRCTECGTCSCACNTAPRLSIAIQKLYCTWFVATLPSVLLFLAAGGGWTGSVPE